MIAILDYGSGNIRSAQRALERVETSVEVTSDYQVALNADGLVVPGVGAFGSCMSQLQSISGDELIKERFKAGRPALGICVGMQVLFSSSEESPQQGINLFSTTVRRLNAPVLPHIGWNEVTKRAPDNLKLLKGIEGERFYFVHSYAVMEIQDGLDGLNTASSKYGEEFIAALEFGSISAVQFHPEKSGEAGLQLLKNWSEAL